MSEWKDSFRMTTFVPADKAEGFVERISDAIPSFLGPYDRVAWWSAAGTEQFRPLEGAQPERGEIGKTARLASVRFEFSLPADEKALQKFRAALKKNHPWDEPVILVFPCRILET